MSKENTQLLSGRSVLITGGAGFIGGHIRTAIKDTEDLLILDNFSSGDQDNIPDQSQVIEVDIRNRDAVLDAVSSVDAIFHQAGLVSVSQSIESPYKSHVSNAIGTINVLDAAKKYDAKVVLASSAAIYGQPEYTPIDETHPVSPTSPYGLDKLTADYHAQLYNDLYGVESTVLRYFNVFGPGQVGGDYAGVIPIFIKQALSGEDITVHGDGEQTRDFVYIDDVVQANLLALQADQAGEAYNIATGNAISIRELAEKIQALIDSSSDIVHTEARSGDVKRSVADISKAKSELQYQPSVSLEEGLEQTIDWWQQVCSGNTV